MNLRLCPICKVDQGEADRCWHCIRLSGGTRRVVPTYTFPMVDRTLFYRSASNSEESSQ